MKESLFPSPEHSATSKAGIALFFVRSLSQYIFTKLNDYKKRPGNPSTHFHWELLILNVNHLEFVSFQKPLFFLKSCFKLFSTLVFRIGFNSVVQFINCFGVHFYKIHHISLVF